MDLFYLLGLWLIQLFGLWLLETIIPRGSPDKHSCLFYLLFVWFLEMLEIKARALHMPGKCFTNGPYLQP